MLYICIIIYKHIDMCFFLYMHFIFLLKKIIVLFCGFSPETIRRIIQKKANSSVDYDKVICFFFIFYFILLLWESDSKVY
jgi:hypothetical protein